MIFVFDDPSDADETLLSFGESAEARGVLLRPGVEGSRGGVGILDLPDLRSVFLGDILRPFLTPEAQERPRFVCVLRSVAGSGGRFLRLLANQPKSLRIEAALVLPGPMEPSTDIMAVLRDECGDAVSNVVRACWFIGNETTEGQPISDDGRSQSMASLVECLIAAGPDLAGSLPLFCQSSGENKEPCFVAWGTHAWRLAKRQSDAKCRALVAGLLADQDGELPAEEKSAIEHLTAFGSSLVPASLALDIPHGIGEGASATRFSERFAQPPENPFAHWRPEYCRETALESGRRRVFQHRADVIRYRHKLIAELNDVAALARLRGQTAFDQQRLKLSEALKTYSSMRGIVLTLRHLFPPLLKCPVDTGGEGERCYPSGSPSESDCLKKFVAESDALLARLCQDLFPGWGWILAWIGMALSVAFPFWMLKEGVQHRAIWAPAFIGAATLGVMALVSRIRTRRIVEAMRAYFDSEYTALRRHFRDKMEWVVRQIARLFQTQIRADAAAVHRRLASRLSYLGVMADGSHAGSASTTREDMDAAKREELAAILGTWSRSVVGEALLDETDADAQSRAAWMALRRRLVSDYQEKTKRQPAVQSELHNCCAITKPPFMAYDPRRFQGGNTSKWFFLDIAMPRDIESSLHSDALKPGIEVRMVRRAMALPTVLVFKDDLTSQACADALARTEFTA